MQHLVVFRIVQVFTIIVNLGHNNNNTRKEMNIKHLGMSQMKTAPICHSKGKSNNS